VFKPPNFFAPNKTTEDQNASDSPAREQTTVPVQTGGGGGIGDLWGFGSIVQGIADMAGQGFQAYAMVETAKLQKEAATAPVKEFFKHRRAIARAEHYQVMRGAIGAEFATSSLAQQRAAAARTSASRTKGWVLGGAGALAVIGVGVFLLVMRPPARKKRKRRRR